MVAKTLEQVYFEIEADNVRLRDIFVSTVPLLTATDFANWIADGSLPPRGLETWLANRLIFSISHNGHELYPAFQFVEKRPRPVIARVLKELVGMTNWQTAFWFVSSNPALDGLAPAEVLDDEGVVVAATQEDGYTG